MIERKRVCGIRCKNAKGNRCRCVCEGATHGSAYRQSLAEQTKEENIEQKAKVEGIETRLTADDLDEIDRLAHYEKQRAEIAVQGRLALEVA